ncbi:MAG TPA: carbon storage regulator, partial [Steroidobacteraceae bacterium]|nr:carbon storage regulator [Steroidobacteraceae bacterium]
GDPGLRDLWLRVLSTPQGRLLLKGNTADAQDENDLDRCLGMTMLVLSRRAGQSLQIGSAIEVELSEISAQNAHFNVTVDEDVAVILPELYDSSMIEPMPRTTEVLLTDGGRRRRLVRVSRTRDQQIMIGADVEIRVIAIFSDRVHLNVDAPTQFVMIRNR